MPLGLYILREKRDLVVSLVKSTPLLISTSTQLLTINLLLLLTFQESLGATQAHSESQQLGQVHSERRGLRQEAVSSRLEAKGSIEQGFGQKAVSSRSRTKRQRKGVSSRKEKASAIRRVPEPLAFQESFEAAQAHPERKKLGQAYPARLRLEERKTGI